MDTSSSERMSSYCYHHLAYSVKMKVKVNITDCNFVFATVLILLFTVLVFLFPAYLILSDNKSICY